MTLVGIKYKETEFEGKKYPKYECHFLEKRRLPGMTGSTCVVHDIRTSVLEDDFEFIIGGDYDIIVDEGKVIAVFATNIPASDTSKK